MTKKILILAANPKNTSPLRLDQEIREVDAGLRRSKNRSHFSLEKRLATRVEDLRRALLDEEPHIVHFCGHGIEEGIILEDDIGYTKLVKSEPLANLFKLFSAQTECVLLNACYSKYQAEAINKHIKYVIGMAKEIGDHSAIQFSIGFYDAIGAGRNIEDAFKFGINAIELSGIPEEMIPVLKIREDILQNREESVRELPIPPQVDLKYRREHIHSDYTSVSFPDSANRKKDDDDISLAELKFAQLDALLRANAWREANTETWHRLSHSAGVNSVVFFATPSFLEAINPEDLQMIDQLWEKYSDGKFGFGIQKKIYLKCLKLGGKNNQEKWDYFGTCVGWKIAGSWLRDEYLTFDISAPDGHLPTLSSEIGLYSMPFLSFCLMCIIPLMSFVLTPSGLAYKFLVLSIPVLQAFIIYYWFKNGAVAKFYWISMLQRKFTLM
ncbi:GUN4 domain-containing protein [Phormidesmis sp. 146-33]